MKVLLGVLAAMLLVTPASALERPPDTRLAFQVDTAVRYWATQGMTGCPNGVTAAFFDDLQADDGTSRILGQAADCAIWIDSYTARAFRRGIPRWLRIVRAEDECKLVIHEVGHALGLPHTETGIMAEDFQDAAIPTACRQWARAYVPRPSYLSATARPLRSRVYR